MKPARQKDFAADRTGERAAGAPISTRQVNQEMDSEAVAGLSQTLDELESRLRERSGGKIDKALLKAALKELEGELQGFVRRKILGKVVNKTVVPAKFGLDAASLGAFPFRSDLLARLNAALPAAGSTAESGRNDLAELARKLDDMCRGGVPAGAPRAAEAESPAHAPDDAVGSKTPEEDGCVTVASGRDAKAAGAFDPLAGQARGWTQSAQVPTGETLKREFEKRALRVDNPAAPSLGSDGLAQPQDKSAANQDRAGARPSPNGEIARFDENSAGEGGDRAPPASEGLGAAAREILALLKDPDRAAALQSSRRGSMTSRGRRSGPLLRTPIAADMTRRLRAAPRKPPPRLRLLRILSAPYSDERTPPRTPNPLIPRSRRYGGRSARSQRASTARIRVSFPEHARYPRSPLCSNSLRKPAEPRARPSPRPSEAGRPILLLAPN